MKWIDSVEAAGLLGVKPQTLYAYVSRGLIEARPDAGSQRRSLYRFDDVVALKGRGQRSRKRTAIAAGTMAWGDASIATSISTVHRGCLVYRDRDATLLSESATLEEIAGLLWDVPSQPILAASAEDAPTPFVALATLASRGQASFGRGTNRLSRDAQEAVGTLAAGCGIAADARPLHARLARLWNCDAAGEDGLRRALVLVADHELNASTFATRVAASTGAPLAACLLAGLCALSGPKHGGATTAVRRLLDACADGAGAAVRDALDRHGFVPGFGHPLYPDGDVRARALLAHVTPDPPMTALAEAVRDLTGLAPNIDFALVALSRRANLPDDAPFMLFLLGRSIGWAAHAMEQVRTPALIRPRARYEGTVPSASGPKLPAR